MPTEKASCIQRCLSEWGAVSVSLVIMVGISFAGLYKYWQLLLEKIALRKLGINRVETIESWREMFKSINIQVKEERISSKNFNGFLNTQETIWGSQYPKERFEERIAKLVDHVSIGSYCKKQENQIVGVLFGLTDYAYWLYVTDLGVDRDYLQSGNR